MSYMRSPVYAWNDRYRVHLWASDGQTEAHAFDADGYEGAYTGGIAISFEVFDALVLMRYAELLTEPKAMKRAVKRAQCESGNFGSAIFLEALREAERNAA